MNDHPDYPGGMAVLHWTWRVPLSEQWADVSEEFQDRHLRFWIRASEEDEWTFSQLQELLDALLDSGSEIPHVLGAWAYEVAAERRSPPTRRGPKSDFDRDMRILAGEHILKLLGKSQRQAHQLIGDALNLSREGVHRAATRARSIGY